MQTLATSSQTMTETLSAKRGNIYDATGKTLAISYDTDKVYIDPSSTEDNYKEFVAQKLGDILNVDSSQIIAKLNESNTRF